MAHDHAHHHHIEESNITKAFGFGILLNMVFVMIEAGAAFHWNSLALLSDAGHNLADVASLGLSLLAFRLAKIRPGKNYTYGYQKTTVLAALVNAIILFATVGVIGFQAVQRFVHPTTVPGFDVAWIAGLGIAINLGSAFLFHSKKELNTRAAFLHLVMDAIVSAGVVAGGIIIHYTGWVWVDPLLSLIIAGVIIASTTGLLKSSLRLSLDAVPESLDGDEIKNVLLKVDGVNTVHHLHIWALSSTQNALTAHVVVNDDFSLERMQHLRGHIREELLHHHIHHATLEMEGSSSSCNATDHPANRECATIL